MKIVIFVLSTLFALTLYPTRLLASVIPETEILTYLQEINFPKPELALAIIRVESACNSQARVYDGGCKCNTYGLMQMQLGTARTMGFTGTAQQLLGWKTNVLYGTRFLLSKLDSYPDNIPMAISAYNAGRPLLRKWCVEKKCALNRRFGNSAYVMTVIGEMYDIQNDSEIHYVLESIPAV